MSDFDKDVVHLVRLAAEGRPNDVAALSRRMLRAVVARRPDLASMVSTLAETVAAGPTRSVPQPLPVDFDSRLELLRREDAPAQSGRWLSEPSGTDARANRSLQSAELQPVDCFDGRR